MQCSIRPFVYLFDKENVIRRKTGTLLKAIKNMVKRSKKGEKRTVTRKKKNVNVCISKICRNSNMYEYQNVDKSLV